MSFNSMEYELVVTCGTNVDNSVTNTGNLMRGSKRIFAFRFKTRYRPPSCFIVPSEWVKISGAVSGVVPFPVNVYAQFHV